MPTIAFAVFAYLLGSVSFAIVLSRLFRLPDPRSYGSRNPGATNVLRTGSKLAAALTLLGDAAKGWVAVAAAQSWGPRYGLGDFAIAACALAVFLGHLYPVFLKFKGGKGVATALGVCLALSPWLGLGLAVVWLAVAALWRISSLAALCAAVVAPFGGLLVFGLGPYTAAVTAMALLLAARHRSNIRNLLAGTEGKISRSPSPESGRQG